MPAPQKGRFAQLESSDIIAVQTVPAQRFLRSFSYASRSFLWMACCLPPSLQEQHSSATTTQSLSFLQSVLTAAPVLRACLAWTGRDPPSNQPARATQGMINSILLAFEARMEAEYTKMVGDASSRLYSLRAAGRVRAAFKREGLSCALSAQSCRETGLAPRSWRRDSRSWPPWPPSSGTSS